MRVKGIVIGKDSLSPSHILVFDDKEGSSIFGNMWPHLKALASKSKPNYTPLRVFISPCPQSKVALLPGANLVSGVPVETSGALRVPPLLDAELLEYLLLDVPRLLDGLRRVVLLEDLDERFSIHVEEGLKYTVSLLERIGVVYAVPVVVTGTPDLARLPFSRKIVLGEAEGRRIVYLDGEPLCEVR